MLTQRQVDMINVIQENLIMIEDEEREIRRLNLRISGFKRNIDNAKSEYACQI